MALNTLEINTINRGIAVANKILSEIEPVLHQLNVIYDSEDGVKESITQDNLDLATQLSGLTKAQLDDAIYALTNTLKTAISSSYSQLQGLASRLS